jgi:hypothetical protein
VGGITSVADITEIGRRISIAGPQPVPAGNTVVPLYTLIFFGKKYLYTRNIAFLHCKRYLRFYTADLRLYTAGMFMLIQIL